jgi:hypothetical protein
VYSPSGRRDLGGLGVKSCASLRLDADADAGGNVDDGYVDFVKGGRPAK